MDNNLYEVCYETDTLALGSELFETLEEANEYFYETVEDEVVIKANAYYLGRQLR